MRFPLRCTCLFLLVTSASATAIAEQTLSCPHTDTPPKLDGLADDKIWTRRKPLVTHDRVAGIDHRLWCAWDGKRVYLLVAFPDESENREHKTLIWNADDKRYLVGPEREDTLVLKWSLEPFPIDLEISSDEPYRADIWFWKAVRTDPTGHADDKLQVYSQQPLADSLPLLSKSYQQFYLVRKADPGTSAYEEIIPTKFEDKRIPAYRNREPEGSRADIKAKGHWDGGYWHVEFARDLMTHDADDIQLVPNVEFQFGISRYEIAGRDPDTSLQIPLYGSGDIGESLFLKLEHK